jgi:hypothetical protein
MAERWIAEIRYRNGHSTNTLTFEDFGNLGADRDGPEPGPDREHHDHAQSGTLREDLRAPATPRMSRFKRKAPARLAARACGPQQW